MDTDGAKDSSPALMTPGQALLANADGKGVVQGRRHYLISCQMSGSVSSSVLPREVEGPTLPSDVSGEARDSSHFLMTSGPVLSTMGERLCERASSLHHYHLKADKW